MPEIGQVRHVGEHTYIFANRAQWTGVGAVVSNGEG